MGTKKSKVTLAVLLAVIMMAFTAIVAVKYMLPTIVEAATEPTISKTKRNILIGEKYNLNINNKVAKSTYKWTSSDDKIATVDKRGIVTAKSKGIVDITCTITTPDKTVYRVSCKVTVREPALHFRIINKVSVLNLGQEYDLNRRLAPSSSNDRTTWTSSDPSIANPDSMGRFIALKEGKVTITGTTISGKSDSVTITVIDKEGLVSSQEELDALLGTGVGLITLKTDAEETIKIKSAFYQNQTLIVDAPNASVENYGKFKVIEIKQIKTDSWYERAVGNLLRILDGDARIVVASFASVSIEVNEKEAVLKIVNNGIIEEIVINQGAELDISGKSEEAAQVIVNVADLKIKTSVPLNLTCNEKIELEILPGAEKTTVRASSKDVVPTIKGNVTINVEIDDGDDQEVIGQPVPTRPPTSGGGGGYIPGPSPDPTPTPKPEDSKTYYIGSKEDNNKLENLGEITVKYGGLTINVPEEIVDELKGFLANEDKTIEKWKDIKEITTVRNGIEIKVTGVQGELKKTVEFSGLVLDGHSYDVTVNPSANSVKLKGGSQTFTVQMIKGTGDTGDSIKISPAPSVDPEFKPTGK